MRKRSFNKCDRFDNITQLLFFVWLGAAWLMARLAAWFLADVAARITAGLVTMSTVVFFAEIAAWFLTRLAVFTKLTAFLTRFAAASAVAAADNAEIIAILYSKEKYLMWTAAICHVDGHIALRQYDSARHSTWSEPPERASAGIQIAFICDTGAY